MIDAAACREIIRTYTKHGWILRRVLLTVSLRKSLGETSGEIFGDAKSYEGDIDAAWFSRQPQAGEIAWEIRHLSKTPFALLEYVDENTDDFEQKLRAAESRLAATVAAKRNA